MGERFLFLAERLPVISLWQAEAMTLDLLAAPESRQALTESGERHAALERAEGLAGTPRDVIEHAAWRGAQLIVLLFVLLAAYRFGPALIGRRASSSS